MMQPLRFKAFAAALLASCLPAPAAFAGDQAKDIVNSLDPKSMNELIEVSRAQPDAALTNIVPASANTFRFLFVWPASNPTMTFDRVERAFAERFTVFAEQWKLLASGFCLSGSSLFFGTAPYGGEEVNIAYRNIGLRYAMGRQPPCEGRYVSLAEVENRIRPAPALRGYSIGSLPLPSPHTAPSPQAAPQEGLKPFLDPNPPAPPQ